MSGWLCVCVIDPIASLRYFECHFNRQVCVWLDSWYAAYCQLKRTFHPCSSRIRLNFVSDSIMVQRSRALTMTHWRVHSNIKIKFERTTLCVYRLNNIISCQWFSDSKQLSISSLATVLRLWSAYAENIRFVDRTARSKQHNTKSKHINTIYDFIYKSTVRWRCVAVSIVLVFVCSKFWHVKTTWHPLRINGYTLSCISDDVKFKPLYTLTVERSRVERFILCVCIVE